MNDLSKPPYLIRPSLSELAQIRAQVEALKEIHRTGEFQERLAEARAAAKWFRDLAPSRPSTADVQKAVQDALASREALADWVRLQRSVPPGVWRAPQSGAVRSAWHRQISEAKERLLPYQRPLVDAFRVEEEKGHNERVISAGWLPHSTGPALSSGELNAVELSSAFEAHYRAQWPTVRSQLADTVANARVDGEAKIAFTEALEAHEHGLYRAACRLLLVEIERVARAEFGPKVRGAPIALMKRAFGELPLSCFGGPAGARTIAMRRFTDGLYRQINNEQDFLAAEADRIPNRHACIHGQVSYASLQNSINALLMTEFVFAMLTEMRLQRVAKEAASLLP